jgi:hypothetical protein
MTMILSGIVEIELTNGEKNGYLITEDDPFYEDGDVAAQVFRHTNATLGELHLEASGESGVIAAWHATSVEGRAAIVRVREEGA